MNPKERVMMKSLDGRELAGYVKERQAKEVRRLTAAKIQPKLVIVSEGDNRVNDLYTKLKQNYGRDIGVDVQIVHTKDATDSKNALLGLNQDDSVHGVIVQLPLSNPAATDEVVNLIEPKKDIDGLGKEANYQSATATAVLWLLAGYAVDLEGKSIVLVGQGRLVGAPLAKMLTTAGYAPLVLDEDSPNIENNIRQADVLITATGQPGLIKSEDIKRGAVVIDAGTSSEGGEIKGDVSDEARQRDDIAITPKTGGLGPLTIAVLFDNLLRAARGKVSP